VIPTEQVKAIRTNGLKPLDGVRKYAPHSLPWSSLFRWPWGGPLREAPTPWPDGAESADLPLPGHPVRTEFRPYFEEDYAEVLRDRPEDLLASHLAYGELAPYPEYVQAALDGAPAADDPSLPRQVVLIRRA
jgi:hypothetical protein